MIRMLGADAALAVPDTRAERTVNQVISPQAYDMLFQRCARRAAAPSTPCRLGGSAVAAP